MSVALDSDVAIESYSFACLSEYSIYFLTEYIMTNIRGVRFQSEKKPSRARKGARILITTRRQMHLTKES